MPKQREPVKNIRTHRFLTAVFVLFYNILAIFHKFIFKIRLFSNRLIEFYHGMQKS